MRAGPYAFWAADSASHKAPPDILNRLMQHIELFCCGELIEPAVGA